MPEYVKEIFEILKCFAVGVAVILLSPLLFIIIPVGIICLLGGIIIDSPYTRPNGHK